MPVGRFEHRDLMDRVKEPFTCSCLDASEHFLKFWTVLDKLLVDFSSPEVNCTTLLKLVDENILSEDFHSSRSPEHAVSLGAHAFWFSGSWDSPFWDFCARKGIPNLNFHWLDMGDHCKPAFDPDTPEMRPCLAPRNDNISSNNVWIWKWNMKKMPVTMTVSVRESAGSFT